MSVLDIIVSKVLIPFWKPIAFVLLMASCTFGGWKANTFYTGYKESIELKIEKKVDAALSKIESQNTKNYVETKQIMQNNAKVIETKVPVIIEREVYRNVCLDEEGVKLLNDLKQNSLAAREKFK
ncbi:hypothetical protein FOI42_RS03970 [Escherichia coli]|nr:hypothetical protein [Escherichia coli]MED6699468.1 hypothetical protein [Escherichia coli O157]USL83582.1 hypothetical protein A4_506 [Escherichia phage A4]HCQ0858523.1 hypothetical protein [Escherichia coli]